MTWLAHIVLILTILYGAIILLFMVALRYPHRPMNTQAPRVSVIIAARNEEKNISSLLQDLLQQDYPVALYEVIVANDGSTDRTAELVLAIAAQHNQVRLLDIRETPAGFSPKKYALQCAVEHSNGDILLATDADCRVCPMWIRSMVGYFSTEVGFVIGFSQYGRPGQQQKWIERLQAFDFVTLMGVAAASTHLGCPLAASGQNLAFRREAFFQVNGYHRISGRMSGDDVLLMQLIRKQTSYRILYASDPDSFVVSTPQPTWVDFINQRNRWASNGGYQLFLSPMFFAYLILTFSYNFTLLLGLTLLCTSTAGRWLIPFCFVAKGWFEFCISRSACRYFNRQDLLVYFPPWFLLQIPYVVLVGLMGSLGLFRWKGRKGATKLNCRLKN